MMTKRVGYSAAAAMTVVVTLTGCTSSSPAGPPQFFDQAAVSESEVRLGAAVMAFFVGPQNAEMHTVVGEVHKLGYMVLVNADGSFRAVRTKRMDMMRPAWSDDGLYFADEGSDYHLGTSGLTKVANQKTPAQNLMFGLPSGGSLGVYNDGQGEGDSYKNRVAVTTDGDARMYGVQGNYFTGALCGSQMFGLTGMPGNHALRMPKLPGMTATVDPAKGPQMLARLYPADDGEKVIAWRPYFGGSTPIGQVPCHDGVITFLSWDYDANGREQPKIVSWDTATGDYQAHPLTFDDSTKLNLDDFGYAVQHLQDDQLHWVYADGRVFSTATATGKTTTIFNTALGTGSRPTQTLFAFSDTELHTLSTTRSAQGNLTYTVFNRAGGRASRKVAVPIPNAKVNVSHLGLSHMAIPSSP